MKEIYRYTTDVDIPKPWPEELGVVRRLINKQIIGKELLPLDEKAPQELQDAHWYLNAGCRRTVEVAIFEDGHRELVCK